SGTSTQHLFSHDSNSNSDSCVPLAPSSKSKSYGSSAPTCFKNISHCTLNALSNSSLSGTSSHCDSKSNGFGISGFHVGFGVFTRCCVLQSLSPATALPSVPSTVTVNKSSRFTRTAHDEFA